MKFLEELKKELKEKCPSLLKEIIEEPGEEEKKEKNDFLIFEEGKGTFTFELEENESKAEEIDDIIRLLKIGQYDQAIEKIRELKAQKEFGL